MVDAISAREEVLGNVDLVRAILEHVGLDPQSFVEMGLVSKAWRGACVGDQMLLMVAARSPEYLNKTVFSGLFGLAGHELDTLPCDVVWRSHGRMFKCREPAIEAALPLIGGMEGWRDRLAQRAKHQASVERTFGPDWRDLLWIASGPPELNLKRRRL